MFNLIILPRLLSLFTNVGFKIGSGVWELPFGLVCRLQYMKGFTGGEQNLKASMSKKGE